MYWVETVHVKLTLENNNLLLVSIRGDNAAKRSLYKLTTSSK